MSLTITALTALTYTSPDRATQSQSAYSANASACAAAWKILGNELITFATEAGLLAAAVETDAATASAQATAAAASATEASGYVAQAQALANFVGLWSDQTGAAAIPYSVSHNGSTWRLIAALADVTTVEPGVTGGWATYWEEITFGVGTGGGTSAMPATLTSSTLGARTLTATDYGQALTLPDETSLTEGAAIASWFNNSRFPILIKDNEGVLLGFIDPHKTVTASLANATWMLDGHTRCSVSLSADIGNYQFAKFDAIFSTVQMSDGYDLVFLLNSSSHLYCAVVDIANGAVSTPVVIRAATSFYFEAIKVEADKVLCVSGIGTAYEAVIISRSGSSPVVNDGGKGTDTLAGAYNSSYADANPGLQLSGTGEVFHMWSETSVGTKIRSITWSGITVTLGTEIACDGTNTSNYGFISNGAGGAVTFSFQTSTQWHVQYFTVSGATLTEQHTLAIGNSSPQTMSRLVQSGGYYWALFSDGYALLVSLSGTTLTGHGLYTLNGGSSTGSIVQLSDTKWFFCNYSTNQITANCYKRVADVDSIGTPSVIDCPTPSGTSVVRYDSANELVFAAQTGSGYRTPVHKWDVSGDSPVYLGFDLYHSVAVMTLHGSTYSANYEFAHNFVLGSDGSAHALNNGTSYDDVATAAIIESDGAINSYITHRLAGDDFCATRVEGALRANYIYSIDGDLSDDCTFQLWEAA